MVLSFSTNPYNNYYTADLKELIALDKSSKQDFHPDTHFDLIPGNADAFAAEIEKYAKQFGYSFLLNVPTARQVDTNNANLFAYSNLNHMLETWNRVTDKNIAIGANEIWGTQDWTHGNNDFQIAEMTQACGEVENANVVTWSTGNLLSCLIKLCNFSLLKRKWQLKFPRGNFNGLILCPMIQLMMVVLFCMKFSNGCVRMFKPTSMLNLQKSKALNPLIMLSTL
jgi:hypothetical protein